jgi:hypothetical protein
MSKHEMADSNSPLTQFCATHQQDLHQLSVNTKHVSMMRESITVFQNCVTAFDVNN